MGGEISEVPGVFHGLRIVHILPEAAVVGYKSSLFLVAHGIPVELYQSIVIHKGLILPVFFLQGFGKQLHKLLLGPALRLNGLSQQLSYLFLREYTGNQLLQLLSAQVAVRILHTAEEVLRQFLRSLGLQSGGELVVLIIQLVNQVAFNTLAFLVTAACLPGRYIVQILGFDPDIPCPGYLHGQAFRDIHDERTIRLAYAHVAGYGEGRLCVRSYSGGIRLINEYHCILAVGQQAPNHALGIQEYGAGAVVGGDALKANIPIGSVFDGASVVGIHLVDDYIFSGILIDLTVVGIKAVGAYAAAGIHIQDAAFGDYLFCGDVFACAHGHVAAVGSAYLAGVYAAAGVHIQLAVCEVHIAGGDVPGNGVHNHIAAIGPAHVAGLDTLPGVHINGTVIGDDFLCKFNVLAGIQVRRSVIDDSYLPAIDASSCIHVQNDAVHNGVRVESDILVRADVGVGAQHFLAVKVAEDQPSGAGGYLQRIAGGAYGAGAVAVDYHIAVIGDKVNVVLGIDIRVELLQQSVSVYYGALHVLQPYDYVLAFPLGLNVADMIQDILLLVLDQALAELGVWVGGEDAAVGAGDEAVLDQLIVYLVPVLADGQVVGAVVGDSAYQLVFPLLYHLAVLIGAVVLDAAGQGEAGFAPDLIALIAGIVIVAAGEVLGDDVRQPLQVDALVLQEGHLGTVGIVFRQF